MEEDPARIEIPSKEADPTEKMVFLQEQLVNFLRQYDMPLIEVSLVLSKYTRNLCEALEKQAAGQGEQLPQILAEPWPLLGHEVEEGAEGPGLETLLDHLDEDRMDILDTILRTSMTATEMAFTDALMQLRQWEHLVRSQLADARGAGQLYSPLEIPEDW
jgi:hypothetical protein